MGDGMDDRQSGLEEEYFKRKNSESNREAARKNQTSG
jgi:hypothetical protein